MKSEGRGRGRINIKNLSSAKIDTLKALIERDPENSLGRYGLANEYFKSEMFEEAVTAIHEYLNIKDDEGAVYRMLAECYMNLGKPEMAREAYVKGIEAANRHGHPGMAEEFQEAVEFMDE
jgi:predicted Zn-dependent protease